MNNTVPDFWAWKKETLIDFAEKAHQRINELEEANAQLRQDFKDAMALTRLHNKDTANENQ